MARTPRHSKPKSESITIDLDEKDVKPVDDKTSASAQTDKKDDVKSNAGPDGGKGKPADKPEDAKPKKASGAKKAEPKTSSGSTFSAGILGAVLALVGAAGLQWGGILPGMGGNQSDAIAALEQKIAGLEENLGQANSQIAEQLTLQPTDELTNLVTRVDALETLLQNDSASSLEALNEVNGQVEQLTSKIINIETNIANIGTGDAEGSVPQGLSDELGKLSALSTEQEEKIADLQAQIVSLAQSSSDSTDISGTITELQKRLAEAETAIAEPRNDISIARSLAATTVRSAINRGGTFVAELEAFAQIDPEHAAIAELKPIAEKGVATRTELIGKFGAVANQIIAADTAVEGEADIMSRLLNSAASMVKVRKVGDVEGDDAEAIAARIETRLNEGKLVDAVREWEKLSDKAKAASQNFQTQLNDRILAESLSDKLMQAAPANAS